MKKRDNYQTILLGSVILCAVFTFVTMAWAAFTTTLSINGSATVKAQTWNVYWSAASVDSTNTTASNVSIDNIGTSTNTITLSSLAATYDTPGQKAVYDVSITNSGTFDAKYVEYTAPTITCTDGTNTVALADAQTAYNAVTGDDKSSVAGPTSVCAFMTYELKVKNAFTGDKTSSVTAGTDFTSLPNSFVLDKTSGTGSTVDLELTIYFDRNEGLPPSGLPTADITVNFQNLKLKFNQD